MTDNWLYSCFRMSVFHLKLGLQEEMMFHFLKHKLCDLTEKLWEIRYFGIFTESSVTNMCPYTFQETAHGNINSELEFVTRCR